MTEKARCRIKFIGNYKGTKTETETFRIEPIVMSDCNMISMDLWYAGKPGTYVSKPYVSYDGYAVPTSSYTVRYYDSDDKEISSGNKIELGEGDTAMVMVLVKGKGNYSGEGWTYYTVYDRGLLGDYGDLSKAKADIVDNNEESISKLEYTGGELCVGKDFRVTVTCADETAKVYTLKQGEDYDVFCHSNINAGNMTIIIQGTGRLGAGGLRWHGASKISMPIVARTIK